MVHRRARAEGDDPWSVDIEHEPSKRALEAQANFVTEAEGMTLLLAPNSFSGYEGVSHSLKSDITKQYEAFGHVDGKKRSLGSFGTALEAAIESKDQRIALLEDAMETKDQRIAVLEAVMVTKDVFTVENKSGLIFYSFWPRLQYSN